MKPRDDDPQVEAEPLGVGWRIGFIVVLGVVVVALIVMAVALLTH